MVASDVGRTSDDENVFVWSCVFEFYINTEFLWTKRKMPGDYVMTFCVEIIK